MVRSTFAGFTTVTHALSASQRAIDVAGQNIANMNTTGYTRQRLDLVSIQPAGPGGGFSSHNENRVGQGVMINGIVQIRDPFLDMQYRTQSAKVGTASATDEILSRIGQIFDETDSTAVRAALNDVISQLKSMAETPNASEEEYDTIVRSSFEVLLNIVHENATRVDELASEYHDILNDDMIPEINSLLTDITEINKAIKASEVLSNQAHELHDQRNLMLDQLSQYLPISVEYVESTDPGVTIELLKVTFKDTAGNVHTLIDDDAAGEFTFGTAAGGEPPYTLTITDAVNPTGATSSLDVADMLGNGVLKGILDMTNKSEIFDGTDTRGIGYYDKMFDTFINTMAQELNYLNSEKDAAGNVTTAINLFETTDGSTIFTANNIKVSDDWVNGSIGITKTFETAGDGSDLSTAYDNVLRMINLLSVDELTFRYPDHETGTSVFTGTVQGIYDSLQSVQSIDRKSSSSILANHLSVLEQIDMSIESISGVSQDEETMDLMRFQSSYNAAARVMTTLDEMLDKLINNTGIVGR